MTVVHGLRRRHRTHVVYARREQTVDEKREWPFWLTILVLYGGIALLGAFMMTLAFVVAKLVTGSAV
jgi:hypothetical protein